MNLQVRRHPSWSVASTLQLKITRTETSEVSTEIIVHTSDDTIYVMDDYGRVHVYEVQPDGQLVIAEPIHER
jgi:hypothetical protein